MCDLGLDPVTVYKAVALDLVREVEDRDEHPGKGIAGLGQGVVLARGQLRAARCPEKERREVYTDGRVAGRMAVPLPRPGVGSLFP